MTLIAIFLLRPVLHQLGEVMVTKFRLVKNRDIRNMKFLSTLNHLQVVYINTESGIPVVNGKVKVN
jgi:hypothetical protein